MYKMIYFFYRLIFARVVFYRLNKLLYGLSLRGMGILNYESNRLSGERRFLIDHVTMLRAGVVLDVGANVGKYSMAVKAVNPKVEIFAFEPHPDSFRRLSTNVGHLGIRLYNVGVGASAETLVLYDYAGRDGSSHASLYKAVIEEIHQSQAVGFQVKLVTLDDFAAKQRIDWIDLLKIDAEGHELEVLKGFGNYIRAGRVGVIHFEFNEMNIVSRVSFRDFWELLPNYDFYRMLPDGLVPIKKYSPVFCEIYAYQNIVAKLKPTSRL